MNECQLPHHHSECMKEIHSLYLSLIAEKQKNEAYRQILEQKYTQDNSINELISKAEKLFNDVLSKQVNTTNGAVNGTVNVKNNEDEEYHCKKKVFKAPPKTTEIFEDITEEAPTNEMEPKISEKMSLKITEIFGDIDMDSNATLSHIQQACEKLKSIKTLKDASTIFSEIAKFRNGLKLLLSPSCYLRFIKENVSQIKHIISENKKLDVSKVLKILTRTFSALDQRLVKVSGINDIECEQNITADEVEKFKLGFKYNIRHSQLYDERLLFDEISNYGLALMSIKDITEMYMEDMKTLVYAPINDDSDHTFYFLERINGSKRCWTLDGRLEKFTLKMQGVIRDYCVNVFRYFYKSVMGTNNYIEKYQTKSNILEFDGEQLIRNLVSTIHFINLNTTLRDIVKSSHTLKITPNDKFDIYADDEPQARTFKRFELSNSEIVTSVQLLFDNLDPKTALDIYKQHHNV